MKKTIIAISRSYGSGGANIARKLADDLELPLFDRKIIEMAAEKSGLSPDYIDNLENHATSSFLFNLASASYPTGSFNTQYDMPITYSAYSAQSQVIQEIAEGDSCVIVGRCAEYVLRDNPDCVKILIYANRADRVKLVMDEYKCSERAAESKLNKLDKARATYYKDFTGENWGNMYAHDLCINSSFLGYDGTTELIKNFLHDAGRL